MGIREWTNNHPKATGGAVGACILASVGVLVVEAMGNRRSITTTTPNDFFSVDDGKSFFSGSGTNMPPFDYEGKTAVRAHVFDCGGARFVGYLERYTPDALKVELSGKQVPPSVELNGRELKKPGDLTWVSSSDMKAVAKVLDVKCPSGSDGTPDPVEP